jgi:hypothetical protein
LLTATPQFGILLSKEGVTMDWKRWIATALVTGVGAGTVLEVHDAVVNVPHIEVNVPRPPPRFTRAVAVTGSGPLLDNVYNTASTTNYVASGTVFFVRR